MRFPIRAESSSDSDSLGGTRALLIYSSEIVPTAVIELTSPTMWQGDFTAK